MGPASGEGGFNPPQQARSRDALRRVLASAEEVLATDGYENFTMAAVAEHAGVSIGAIYRRFSGREQLLAAVKDRVLGALEAELVDSLAVSGTDLRGVVHTYVGVIASNFSAHRHALPDLLRSPPRSELEGRGRQAIERTKQIFEEAVEPHLRQIRRPDPRGAVAVVQHSVTGACIHRASSFRVDEDVREWEDYSRELAEMAVAYLLSAPEPRPG